MKSVFVFLVGAVVGTLATLFLATGVMTGVGAGVGIATGLQAGVCATAEAAKSNGFITTEQVDALLAAAGRELAGVDGTDAPALPGGDAACQEVISKLKAARG